MRSQYVGCSAPSRLAIQRAYRRKVNDCTNAWENFMYPFDNQTPQAMCNQHNRAFFQLKGSAASQMLPILAYHWITDKAPQLIKQGASLVFYILKR